MKNFANSLKEILTERISSPFYGSLIVSWLLWNWQIPYVTFFVNESKLKVTRIEYIIQNCSDIWNLLWLPLISTVVIIAIIPLITNGSYWITLIYDRWRIDKKTEVNKNRVLTVEQSIDLMSEIQNQEEKFKTLLSKRDEEINLLKSQLDSAIKKSITKDVELVTTNQYNKELDKFLKDKKRSEYIEDIDRYIRGGLSLDNNIPNEILNYYVAYELIETSGSYHAFTKKGKTYLKAFLKEKLDISNTGA